MAGTNKEMVMATGRRKCAVAVVKLVKGKGRIFVNGKTLQAYNIYSNSASKILFCVYP